MKLNILISTAKYDQAVIEKLNIDVGSDIGYEFIDELDPNKFSEDENVEVNILVPEKAQGIEIDAEVCILDVDTSSDYIQMNHSNLIDEPEGYLKYLLSLTHKYKENEEVKDDEIIA